MQTPIYRTSSILYVTARAHSWRLLPFSLSATKSESRAGRNLHTVANRTCFMHCCRYKSKSPKHIVTLPNVSYLPPCLVKKANYCSQISQAKDTTRDKSHPDSEDIQTDSAGDKNGTSNGIRLKFVTVPVPFAAGASSTTVQDLKFRTGYVDTGGGADAPIVLGLHGTPGTHKDLWPVTHQLVRQGARLILPNLPGYGITSGINKATDRLFHHSNEERVKFILGFLKEIGVSRVNMLVIHSAGTFPALSLLAEHDIFDACAFICPTAAHMHFKSLRPFWLVKLTGHWARQVILRDIIKYAALIGFRLYGVNTMSVEGATNGLLMASQVDIYKNREYIEIIRQKRLPMLAVYANNDRFIEPPEIEEFLIKLGMSLPTTVKYDKNSRHLEKSNPSLGTYRRLVLLDQGSHFPQYKDWCVPLISAELMMMFQSLNTK